MSDVKRYTVQGRDWQLKEDESGTFVLAVEYDALLVSRDQAWKAANSECQDWAREYEKRRAVEAKLDQLRAEVQRLRSYEAEWEHVLNELRAELAAIRGQEPVAWMDEDGALHTTTESAHFRGAPVTPLYALPPQQPDAVSVPSDTALRRAAKFLAGIDNGCNEVKTLRALVANAQEDAVSVPRELAQEALEMAIDDAGEHQCSPCFNPTRQRVLDAQVERWRALLSTRQAEEGE